VSEEHGLCSRRNGRYCLHASMTGSALFRDCTFLPDRDVSSTLYVSRDGCRTDLETGDACLEQICKVPVAMEDSKFLPDLRLHPMP